MQTEGTPIPSEQPLQKKERPPIGMILLSLFLVYSAYTQLYSLKIPFIIFGPFVIEGIGSIVFKLFSAAASLGILYGIIKRKSWTVTVALLWYGFSILQAVVHAILSIAYQSTLPEAYKRMPDMPVVSNNEPIVLASIIVVSVLAFVIDGVICWYLYSEKSYFAMDGISRVDSIDFKQLVIIDSILVKRAVAAVLDYLLYIAVTVVSIYLGVGWFLAITGFWILYFPGLEGILGYTPFKGLFDLKLVKDNRKDARFFAAFQRHLLDPIDFMFFGSVALLVAKIRPDQKRLGDMFAHTHIELAP